MVGPPSSAFPQPDSGDDVVDVKCAPIRRNLEQSESSCGHSKPSRDGIVITQPGDGQNFVEESRLLGNLSLERPASSESNADCWDLADGCHSGNTTPEVGLTDDVLKENLTNVDHRSTSSDEYLSRSVASPRRTSARDRAPATGVMSICGRRREMEDNVTVVQEFFHLPCKVVGGCLGACGAEQDIDLPLRFFGVYDGHGGAQAANFCKERLHLALVEEIRALICSDKALAESTAVFWENKWQKVMSATFLRVDAEIEGLSRKYDPDGKEVATEILSEPIAPETVGSTAVVAVVGSCQIIIANCGDSRAVLSRGGQAIALSVDHKPDRSDEMARIEAAGGKVINWNGYRVFGVLAMSRAIGDRYLKPYVIAEPEVRCLTRSEDDDCLVLASDGLWEVLTSEEVCDVARRRLAGRCTASVTARSASSAGSNVENAEAAAMLLTKMALAQGSNDNISVVVVDLKDRT